MGRNTFLRSATLGIALVAFTSSFFVSWGTTAQEVNEDSPSADQNCPTEDNPLIDWLLNNVFEDGMPRSFEIPKGRPDQIREFWLSIGGDTVPGVIERLTINQGLNIYDGSVRNIALAFEGGDTNLQAADKFIQTLKSGRWGDLQTIRASASPFAYQGRQLPPQEAYFFRTITNHWAGVDPLTGQDHYPGYPGPDYDRDKIVWPDWQPITGENAWVIIQAIQVAKAKYGDSVPLDSDEIKLALSLTTPIKALMTDIGTILRAPSGTFGTSPYDISNENNHSVYNALTLLYAVTQDQQFKDMADKIKEYMKRYGRDPLSKLLYLGGSYRNGVFTPYRDPFAVDVQTWGILSYTPQGIDEMYEEGAAYQIWQQTKRRAGYLQDGVLYGVGYTDGHDIFSGEWTAGAVAATLELYLYYQESHPEWAWEALHDAISMMQGLETLSQTTNIGKSYLYANKRYQIPFGWNANAIPSTASTSWMAYLMAGKNPFRLGGETSWLEIPEFKQVVDDIKASNIWARGIMESATYDEWQSKVVWEDFYSTIPLVAGQKLKITYTLVGGNGLGVQMVGENDDPAQEGDMIRLTNAGGVNKTVMVTVPSNRNLAKLAFQIGTDAWGPLEGGSQSAKLAVFSVVVVGPGDVGRNLYLPDQQEPMLPVTMPMGGVKNDPQQAFSQVRANNR